MGHLIWWWDEQRTWELGAGMWVGIRGIEAELREAGHTVERDYLFEGQDSHDGAGWVVRVDGEVVASGASIGALEDRLRWWLEGCSDA